MSMRKVLDVPLCLGVLKHRVLLDRGGGGSSIFLPNKMFYDGCLLMLLLKDPYNLVVKYRFIFIKLALNIYYFYNTIPKLINL